MKFNCRYKEKISDKLITDVYVLAYTRKNVIFRKYDKLNIDELFDDFDNEDILELHIFNDECEYRMIKSRSKRFNGYVESFIDDELMDKNNSSYSEECILEKKPDNSDVTKISIINYLSYSDNEGMAYIDNYRLKIGGNSCE